MFRVHTDSGVKIITSALGHRCIISTLSSSILRHGQYIETESPCPHTFWQSWEVGWIRTNRVERSSFRVTHGLPRAAAVKLTTTMALWEPLKTSKEAWVMADILWSGEMTYVSPPKYLLLVISHQHLTEMENWAFLKCLSFATVDSLGLDPSHPKILLGLMRFRDQRYPKPLHRKL